MTALHRIFRLQDAIPATRTQARSDWIARHLDEIRSLAATPGRNASMLADLLGLDHAVLARILKEAPDDH